ncbi:MAG TPA: NUDIX domain-containing protein [Verrucomicrobiae bacterium]|jgi:ADP-ribose pyrophosphatase YjhB (NUDIX family)
MKPGEHFHHCPRCGQRRSDVPGGSPFVCAACGFTYYFNDSIATAVFITRDDGQVLFIRRAKAPAKGKLSPPGGFVDIGERAEDAIRRETREEVGLEIADLRFLCSQPNSYEYAEVTYAVLDFFFVARAVVPNSAKALDDVESFHWLDPRTVSPDEIAFPSVRAALKVFLNDR